jgi:hypothetical protein
MPIEAWIKPANESSRQTFGAAGFSLDRRGTLANQAAEYWTRVPPRTVQRAAHFSMDRWPDSASLPEPTS